MQLSFPVSIILLISLAGSRLKASNNFGDNVTEPTIVTDTLPITKVKPPKPYSGLRFQKKEILNAAPGTKSVLFNTEGSKLYAMNLEGMSVYEFDQSSRKLIKEYKFSPTKGTGWDYSRNKPIPSFQEKPVEACFSHDDRILWVSLHNAEGIVPIWVDNTASNTAKPGTNLPVKQVIIHYPGKVKKDTVYVPLIITGKTPKVIARTADSRFLFVSNWHSYTISVLELNENKTPYARQVASIPVTAIPRGIVVDDEQQKTFVAIMGGASLAVINNQTWKKDSSLPVMANPRHIVRDTSGHLFVSYNSIGRIACLDAVTGKQLFSTSTHAQPRTIVLSKNHRFVFVTCYTSDMMDVYKINNNNFEKVASLPCEGHPVGVDIYEDDDKLEAWVCSYQKGKLNIYTFIKE